MATISYSNDEELEKVWIDQFQVYMDNARKCGSVDEEYAKQQDVYSKFAKAYDDAIRIEKYSGPVRIAKKVEALFPETKDIKVLDYGCGTGLVGDNLHALGFEHIDGLDPNPELLEESKSKGKMSKLFQMKSTDNHDVFQTGSYDVITSSGTFFLSASHPGFEMLRVFARMIKKGGYIILLVKKAYLDCPFVDHSIIPQLEKEGVVKSHPQELFDGYRQPFKHEEDAKSTGAILTFQIL